MPTVVSIKKVTELLSQSAVAKYDGAGQTLRASAYRSIDAEGALSRSVTVTVVVTAYRTIL